ncbi:MAG: hypothetical protein RL516_1399 [Bacteroidota bacterium]|jgi:hypothetical protein
MKSKNKKMYFNFWFAFLLINDEVQDFYLNK